MTRNAILFTSASVAVLSAAIAWACSPDPGPFFTPQQFPEHQALFDRGTLGLLTPALTKENELLAYRILSGLKVEDPEATSNSKAPSEDGEQTWMHARSAFNQIVSYVSPYRVRQSGQQFVNYQNCLDDAFVTAARTLGDRSQQYQSPPALSTWLEAQNEVFQNCSGTAPVYPPELPANATALERADRTYQIAAAHFYAEDFPEAERRFRAIAADRNSPWHQLGNYLVGRTLLRELSLQQNAAAGTKARQEFAAVAGDASSGTLADSARGLLQHLDAVDHPDVVMASLSKQMLLPRPPQAALADAVAQSAFILKANSFSPALLLPNPPDTFDWVHTLETGNRAHALDKWTATRSLPWLTLTLMYADGKDPAALELIEQSDELKADSPAFGTAQYNAVRLRIERGETEAARRQLDTLLATAKDQPDSLVNGWRAERMRVARNFDDLLHWAPRIPVNADANDASDVLDADGANLLNYSTPLTKLAVASHSPELPPWSAANVAVATWTRAFVLNNSGAARDAAPVVAKAHAGWTAGLTPDSGTQTGEWRFRGALLIARHKEFQPLVPVDYRQPMSPASWWCPVVPPDKAQLVSARAVAWKLPSFFAVPANIVSKAEGNVAEVEVKKLATLGSAQDFLAPIIMAWAKQHPDDPLVPEALHRLVIVVRYGCHLGSANGPISKRAFDLLHTRYPGSEWTKKTPYWFGQ